MSEKAQEYLTQTDKKIPGGFLSITRSAIARYGFLGSLSRYLMMQDETLKFLRQGCTTEERVFRQKLIKRFNLIQKKVPCAHWPYDFVLMAEYILNLNKDGPIIQCGSFKGGCTAKLSLLAQRTKRSLYVCDSFQGLPASKSKEESFLEGHAGSPNFAFSAGEYKGSLGEVRENVKLYGSIDTCIFVPGLFNDSLGGLDVKPAFVFIDVDLISSARDCLKYLWPKLIPGGYWFTHEAVFPQYIKGILDVTWWQETLRESPPVIFGAGSGLSSIAVGLAYFQKENPDVGKE